MINTQSPREILKTSEIKTKLKECFKKCAFGRKNLRKCIVNAMNKGLTKENVLTIVHNMASGALDDEASLCAIVAIGEALRYEENHSKPKPILITEEEKKDINNKLRECFKKCGLARRQLRKCIVNVLDLGFTKDEVLAISDDIVGGFGKNEVSLCAIIAVNQVLQYEEDLRAVPLDIIKERKIEKEDT